MKAAAVVLVKCGECGQEWPVEDDPDHVGGGYPYGWQAVDCGCGGLATPVSAWRVPTVPKKGGK